MSLPREVPRGVSFIVAVYFNMREPIPDLRRSLCLHFCIPLPLKGTIWCKADVCKDKKKAKRCGTNNPSQHTHGGTSL